MKPNLHKALFFATLMLLGSVAAKANDTTGSATGTSSGLVGKVEKAVERGAKAAANGVERGAKAAARGVKRGASAAARGVERGAEATGKAAHTVAKKIGG